jgi:hypothetical protein
MSGNKRMRRRKPSITIVVNAEFAIGKRQIMRVLKMLGGVAVGALLVLVTDGIGFWH